MQRYVLTDGAKAALVDNLPAEAWTVHSGDKEQDGIHKLYSNVAFLYRCVEMRANAIASLPWYIMRGESEVWSHKAEDVPNELLFAEHLPDLLWQIEAAWTLTSEAFLLKLANRVRLRELKWLTPWTITPQWDENDGLIGYERRLPKKSLSLPLEQVVYLRLPGQHETKPRTSPAQAAMAASGVVYNVDLFAKTFFERGAIKATLLTVAGNPLPEERERLKNWWRRTMSSISNAFGAEVVAAEAVKPVVVGDGIESLNSGGLMKERREDIATAMGVPHSMIISNASNFATAKIDRLNFHNTTIVPDAVILQRQLNRQLFNDLGLRFEFRPTELDVYQEDETARAEAFSKYVAAGIPISVAVQMLGINLPNGVKPEDLDSQPEPDLQPVIVQPTQLTAAPEPQVQPQAQEVAQPETDVEVVKATVADKSDMARDVEIQVFRRWLKKRKNPDPSQFNSAILTDADKAAIVTELVEDAAGGDAFFRREWQSYP